MQNVSVMGPSQISKDWIGEILNTKNLNNIVIFWIFQPKYNCYFGFFLKQFD